MPAPDDNPERLVSAARADEESSFELKLRPRLLREFIGQQRAKDQLQIALEAARARGEALDHVLLFGPPGLGKTTLAAILANELDVQFQQTSGPALQIQGDLTAILTNVRLRQVLFLDEIHRLQPVLEEKLYTALEDYKLDIIIGQGPGARTHVMDIKPFTFVAATTRPGLLSSPLRSRFGILLRLEYYSDDELRFVVERSAEVLGVPIDQDGAAEIAMRSRGTPRIANRLLRRVRDYAQVRGSGTIDRATAMQALQLLEVDAHGFDELDRRLLLTIIEKYDGGPVGLNTLAATLAEEQDALEEIYEPSSSRSASSTEPPAAESPPASPTNTSAFPSPAAPPRRRCSKQERRPPMREAATSWRVYRPFGSQEKRHPELPGASSLAAQQAEDAPRGGRLPRRGSCPLLFELARLSYQRGLFT